MSFMDELLENSARFRMPSQRGFRTDIIHPTILRSVIFISHVSALYSSLWKQKNHRKFQKAIRQFFDEIVYPDAQVGLAILSCEAAMLKAIGYPGSGGRRKAPRSERY